MVVLIVAIVMFARVYRDRQRNDETRAARFNDPEAARLREEVKALKERLAVLERIATDSSNSLDRQIEALRDRDTERRFPSSRDNDDPRRDRADLR